MTPGSFDLHKQTANMHACFKRNRLAALFIWKIPPVFSVWKNACLLSKSFFTWFLPRMYIFSPSLYHNIMKYMRLNEMWYCTLCALFMITCTPLLKCQRHIPFAKCVHIITVMYIIFGCTCPTAFIYRIHVFIPPDRANQDWALYRDKMSGPLLFYFELLLPKTSQNCSFFHSCDLWHYHFRFLLSLFLHFLWNLLSLILLLLFNFHFSIHQKYILLPFPIFL